MNKRVIASITGIATAVVMTLTPVVSFASDSVITKSETVYVVTDSTGLQQDVIVSEHLENSMKVNTIKDKSNLSDIENVKGDEEFTQDDKNITWQADGNDIYYQGKTNAQVPLKMNITYKLDGKKISGKKLQGKSGKVEINIKYTNEAKYNDKTVPLIVMSGLIVTDNSFQNIKIDSGKVINDGDKQVVVGLSVPGLDDLISLEDADLSIGDSIKITGDAKKFNIEDIMTLATNSVFEDIDTGDLDLDYDDEIDALNKGAKKLVSGTSELYDGLEQLSDKAPELQKGVSALTKGSKKLLNALKKVSAGTKELLSGSNQISNGLSQVAAGVNGDGTTSNPGAVAGAESLSSGIGQVQGAIGESTKYDTAVQGQLSALKSEISSNENLSDEEKEAYAKAIGTMEAEISGSLQYQSGASSGLTSAKSGADTLASGLKQVSSALNGDGTESNPGLVAGSKSVTDGLKELYSNVGSVTGESSSTVVGGASDLAEGMAELDSSTETLVEGVNDLDDGASQIASGMQKLYKEGIKKIVDLYNDDLKGLTDDLDSIIETGKGYKTFTILPSNMDGNVKFIYRTSITE